MEKNKRYNRRGNRVDDGSGGIRSGGIQSGGKQSDGMQSGGIQSDGMQSGGIQSDGIQSDGMQSGGKQSDGMQSGGIQSGGKQSDGIRSDEMQSGGIQSEGIQSYGMRSVVAKVRQFRLSIWTCILFMLFTTLTITLVMLVVQVNSVSDMRLVILNNGTFSSLLMIFLNFLPILSVMLFLYFISGNVIIALGISGFTSLFLAYINRLKMVYRSDPLRPWDFKLGAEVMGIAHSFSSKLILLSLLMLLAFIGLFALSLIMIRNKKPRIWLRVAATLIVAVIAYLSNQFLYTNKQINDSLYVHGSIYNPINQYNSKGFLYQFIYAWNTESIREPEGFNKDEIINLIAAWQVNGQTGGLSAGQADGMSAGQVGGLSAGQAGGLGAGQVGGLNAGQADGLNAGQTGGLSAGQTGGLNDGQGGTLANIQADGLVDKSEKPHVFVILGEAFSDLPMSPILDYEGLTDPLANYKTIMREADTGYLYVPNVGGGTGDTEFDILTGVNTLSYRGVAQSNSLITRKTNALPWTMSALDYRTIAMHPGYPWFYNRQNVFPFLGFTSATFIDDFIVYENKGGYLSDKDTFDRVLYDFNSHLRDYPNQPLFSFIVGIQNHGPYNGKYFSGAGLAGGEAVGEGVAGGVAGAAVADGGVAGGGISGVEAASGGVAGEAVADAASVDRGVAGEAVAGEGVAGGVAGAVVADGGANGGVVADAVAVDGGAATKGVARGNGFFHSEYPLSAGDANALNNYIYGMIDMDREFGRFIDEMRKSDEPVVVVYYGDHLPAFTPALYEALMSAPFSIDGADRSNTSMIEELSMHRVPYMIWSNAAAKPLVHGAKDFPIYGDMSSFYFGAALLDYLGFGDVEPFFRYLNSIRNEVPVILNETYYTADGVRHIKADERNEAVDMYEKWAYYRIMFAEQQ